MLSGHDMILAQQRKTATTVANEEEFWSINPYILSTVFQDDQVNIIPAALKSYEVQVLRKIL